MLDLLISINSNYLKLTYISKKGKFNSKTELIPDNLINDTQIINILEFSDYLKNVIKNFTLKKTKNIQVTYLVDPKNTYNEVILLDKTHSYDSDPDTLNHEIILKASHQLDLVDINEIYFDHKKIAPFLRYFYGIKKYQLNSILEVFTNIGISLKAVVPWGALLPKYSSALNPSLFIVSNEFSTVFILSEYNNVYFSKFFDKKFKPQELQSYVSDLSNYPRTSNIKDIYYLGENELNINPNFEVKKITIPNQSLQETLGYENHLLAHYMITFDKELLNSDLNFLKLLPLQVTKKFNNALVYVGSSLAIAIIMISLILGGNRLKSLNTFKNTELAGSDNQNNQQVAGVETIASDHNQINESTNNNTQQINNSTTTSPNIEEKDAETIKKSDITIIIENGAGINGLAGRTKEFLEELGYKILDIKDAELTGRENTIIKFKVSNIKYKDLLKNDVDERFLDVIIQDDLPEDEKYDVLIILGSKVIE